MHGEPPKVIPITFEKTKYPLIEQCMHNLIRDREEALAAHELAMRRIVDRQKNTFVPFKKGDKVWLDTVRTLGSYTNFHSQQMSSKF